MVFVTSSLQFTTPERRRAMEIKENNLYEHLAVPKKNVSGQGLTLRPDLDLVLMLDGDPTRMGRNYFRVMIQFSTNEFRSGEWIEALPD